MAYVTWPTFIIVGPLYISGMGEDRDFKFSVWIDRQAYKPKKAKVGQKGCSLCHMTYFSNFGSPFISLEWVKLDFKFGISKTVTDTMLGPIEVE